MSCLASSFLRHGRERSELSLLICLCTRKRYGEKFSDSVSATWFGAQIDDHFSFSVVPDRSVVALVKRSITLEKLQSRAKRTTIIIIVMDDLRGVRGTYVGGLLFPLYANGDLCVLRAKKISIPSSSV